MSKHSAKQWATTQLLLEICCTDKPRALLHIGYEQPIQFIASVTVPMRPRLVSDIKFPVFSGVCLFQVVKKQGHCLCFNYA